METESTAFDADRFRQIVAEGNFLGAWILIREARLDRTEEAIQVGLLAQKLAAACNQARKADDRETLAYQRAVLAYVLRDWPGLASLYREQLKPPLPGIVPENLAELWQEFNDVMSGRKGLDESFRQKMQEAQGKAREYGVDLDPLQDFARQAEKELRKGAQDLGDFLRSVFQGPVDTSGTGAAPGDAMDSAADAQSDTKAADEPVIKVKIQDADAPLPKDIHQAPPADKEQ